MTVSISLSSVGKGTMVHSAMSRRLKPPANAATTDAAIDVMSGVRTKDSAYPVF